MRAKYIGICLIILTICSGTNKVASAKAESTQVSTTYLLFLQYSQLFKTNDR